MFLIGEESVQKYKRPRKYPGLRSIPLRNPRKVDMYRFNTETKQSEPVYERPTEGPTPKCFRPAYRYINESKSEVKFITLREDAFIVEKMFWLDGNYWFEETYHKGKNTYRSRVYTRVEAQTAYATGNIIWVKRTRGDNRK